MTEWLLQEGIDFFDVLTVLCTAMLTRLIHLSRKERKKKRHHHHD